MTPSPNPFPLPADLAGLTLAAVLRRHLPNLSWSQVRTLITSRHVRLDGEACLDHARRLREGVVVEILNRPLPPPKKEESLVVRHLDEHLVVVEKPSGVASVRHPLERTWSTRRKSLHPTLEDLIPALIAGREGRSQKGSLPRLRVVQRLDKDTSGLIVFARTVAAERDLGMQFHAHTVVRRYFAIVPGLVTSQRIATRLIRDRGDGRRGSGSEAEGGKPSVTHVELVERLPGYSLIACRLETGRTHQIRIHLSELGHPLCGDKVYQHRANGTIHPDTSNAPRLALHAAELGFRHPITQHDLFWTSEFPPDLQAFLARLRPSDNTTPTT